MADIYSVRQTSDNAGAQIAAANAGANAKKVAPTSKMGTRELKFLEIAATSEESTVDFTTTYTASDSLYAKAVNAIQGFAELYIVGTPSATEFVVVAAFDTANAGDSNTTVTGYGLMEAAIKDAIGSDEAVTVTELTLTGDDLV